MRYRVPTALERQGDFSQSTDNNGNPYPYIKNPAVAGRLHGRQSGRLLRRRRRARPHPRRRQLYQTGLNILKMWPAAEPRQRPAGQPYNFEITRPSESILSTQPALRFDYQATAARCASASSTRDSASASRCSRARFPAGTTPGWSARTSSLIAIDRQLHLDADAVPRRHRSATAWPTRAAASASAAAADRSSATRSRSATTPTGTTSVSAGCRSSFRRPAPSTQRYFVYDLLNRSGSPMWDGTQRAAAAELLVGQPRQPAPQAPTTRRRTSASPVRTSPRPRTSRSSLTKVWGRHTHQDAASTTSTATSSRCRAAPPAGRR